MYRIGVIGDRESVLGFKAVGLEVFPCDSQQEAKKTFKNIAEDNFAIIYVTEAFYKGMAAEVAEYTDKRLPAVIPIPDKDGFPGHWHRERQESCGTCCRRGHPVWR